MWFLCQQIVFGKVFDEAQAVRYEEYAASHTIEDSTLLIGTYLIHLQALTDELYEKALESASDSNQMNVYYKSELASGTWMDITDAVGLSDLSGQGRVAQAEEMADLEWNADADQEEKTKPEYFEEEPKKRGFFRRNKEEEYFLRDKWILSRIRDEDLMDYLLLEQKRNEQMQRAKDIREKRLVSAFKLSVSLAAGVAIVYLLKDNPTIFVNILYIGGILGGFHFWKNSQGK